MVALAVLVEQLDLVILEGFSSLGNSLILSGRSQFAKSGLSSLVRSFHLVLTSTHVFGIPAGSEQPLDIPCIPVTSTGCPCEGQ